MMSSTSALVTSSSPSLMCQYTFELDEEFKELCTIVTPFGNYRYNRVLMSLKIYLAFAQSKMENCLQDIEELDVYVDNIGIFTGDWSHHLIILDQDPR